MNIKEQQEIADKILQDLSVVDPYVILAGGAPRDWYLGEPAHDLDIYFYSHSNSGHTRKQLEKATGLKVKQLGSGGDPERRQMYKTMKYLVRVFEAECKGIKVQFIQLTEPQANFKIVDTMSVSICKAWYKSGRIGLHEDFKVGFKTNSLFLSEGYNSDDPHPRKIINRFKGRFHLTSRSGAFSRLLRKCLEDL